MSEKKTTATPSESYEQKLQEIRRTLQHLQQGEGTLEEAVQQVEAAGKLIQECRQYLDETELRIQQVLLDEETGELTREDVEIE